MPADYVIDSQTLPARPSEGDTAQVRVVFDGSNGCERLVQAVLTYGPGRARQQVVPDGQQEVFYVVSGRGTLEVDGEAHALEPDMGVFLVAGETVDLDNPGPEPLVLVAVRAPEDREDARGARRVTVRFADQPELRADDHRTYRYLVNEDSGCFDVTQFIGIVQPYRAPDHSHPYDEVGYIVEGEGIAHIAGKQTPIGPGSCFHLPPEEVHCIENTGPAVMRIMGVFHPSGSPASRTYDAAGGN
jgi:mannose-6-phosphate isomerase-like protein (cupin superfamily)